ncbi:manganese efflux pump MntP [Parenemella sanctibonifatiensis]|uniref:Putative manganese efflux pump MntP n=1 Tax=Parenemella sanctibonifatiensis TaxID=2016505 RepID=A0A255EFD5_9ACTN|nr:manganese efflux pump MntP family protein [Parenemella sanctibonifatiensis]OYN90248.1 hypothetical protein CGZ91_08765 [Parenemella sanctibonifatiensis]
MSLWSVLLIGVGVSADAFAAAIASGLKMRRLHHGHALLIAVVFGLFQAVMPLLGWLLAFNFSTWLQPVDHWIAFSLLTLLGGKMIWDVLFGHDDEDDAADTGLGFRRLMLLGIATSIDAAAVGVSMAMLEVNIVPVILIIGLTTMVLSYAGVLVGYKLGCKWRKPAELIGGIVLIGIGARILLEHLGVLA